MTRRRLAFATAVTALALTATLTVPAFPQEDAAEPTPPQEGEAAEGEAAEGEGGGNAVDRILREQEDLMSGMPFSYQPAGRRDPFAPLVTSTGKPPGDKCTGEGIQCMSVNELDLSGIVRDPVQGDVALVIGSDNKGYFLRAGDEVYDGTVISVDSRQGVVMFRQRIDDPRRIKPYRDVPKRLVPLDEETAQ